MLFRSLPGTWQDAGTISGLMLASKLAAKEQAAGRDTGCIERCALRTGCIDRQQFKLLLSDSAGSEYGDYLRSAAP